MSLRNAIDYLAGLTFTGITSNFDLDQLPAELALAHLPALVPELLPTKDHQDQQAMSVLTYDASGWYASYYVQHIAYWLPVGSGRRADFEPAIHTFIDNYLAHVAASPTLNSNLSEKLVILTVEVGEFPYRVSPDDTASVRFYGVKFLHRWRAAITAV